MIFEKVAFFKTQESSYHCKQCHQPIDGGIRIILPEAIHDIGRFYGKEFYFCDNNKVCRGKAYYLKRVYEVNQNFKKEISFCEEYLKIKHNFFVKGLLNQMSRFGIKPSSSQIEILDKIREQYKKLPAEHLEKRERDEKKINVLIQNPELKVTLFESMILKDFLAKLLWYGHLTEKQNIRLEKIYMKYLPKLTILNLEK